MTEFEAVLQECLQDVEEKGIPINECLQRYPRFSEDLEPILLTSLVLARGQEAQVSSAFKTRVRSRLMHEMYARPRRAARPRFSFLRLAASLAVVLLALLTAGTAYAQRALPGETFYPWKLASENAWRFVTPDPVGFDLRIAQRRLNELIAVQDDPALYAQTLNAYLEVKERLQAETEGSNDPRIEDALEAQIEELNGVDVVPELTEPVVIPPLVSPTPTPGDSLPLPAETPRVVPTVVESLPEIVPTVVESLPEVIPTVVENLPDVVATVQNLPEIIPTIDLLP